ncbi:MAG: hypothetical protein QXP82_02605 [Candidatus Aenigmatarchaeota archaeon]
MIGSKRNETLILTFVTIIGAIGLILGLYSLFAVSRTGNVSLLTKNIHWHAKLTILIDGKQIPIPAGVGITTGNNIDNHISGMHMSPIHTHDSTGELHIENLNPSAKPETLTIGYFINDVWGKRFDSECIFDYCNGSLRMFVNGKENEEFEKYTIKDGDEIIIKFASLR